VKDLEARLTHLERILPTEEKRLIALWWEYGDDYVFAKLRDGDVEAALAIIHGALNPEDAAWVIAFSDELVADTQRKRRKTETKD
jgi:hypothetical protein